MSRNRGTSRSGVVAAVLVGVALALVPVALAAKGGNGGHAGSNGGGGHNGGGSSSLSLVMVTDNNGNGAPNWGDQVTFEVSTSASFPSVELDCSQDGAVVYKQIAGFYPTYMWSDTYTLDNWIWTSGAADCTATLYTTKKNGSRTDLATLSFPVGA